MHLEVWVFRKDVSPTSVPPARQEPLGRIWGNAFFLYATFSLSGGPISGKADIGPTDYRLPVTCPAGYCYFVTYEFVVYIVPQFLKVKNGVENIFIIQQFHTCF